MPTGISILDFWPDWLDITESPATEINIDTVAQNPNLVLAGPTSGAAAKPNFRALVDADIPAAIARDSEITADIATHAAIAAAHHTKYTDAEAIAAVQSEATLDLVGILTIGDTGFQLYKSGTLYYIKWGANDYLLLTDDFIGFYVGGGLAISATPTASEFTVPIRLLNNLSVQFREASGSGSQQVTLKGPASLAADRAITLPDADGELAMAADTVLKSLYDAQTIVAAVSDNTPVAVTVAEQRVVGRLTGGNIDDIAIGIADDSIIQIDDAAAADDQYARFTAAGLEGRTVAEARADIGNGAKQTLVLEARSGAPATTAGCSAQVKIEHGTNDIDHIVMDFDATTKEYAVWEIVMPDNYDGSTITAIFYWTTSQADAAKDVRWGLQGRAYGDGETLDQAYGTAQEVTDTCTATAYQQLISAATSAITLAGTPAGGEKVIFRAYRDPAHADDDSTVDARLMAIKIEFGITDLGA